MNAHLRNLGSVRGFAVVTGHVLLVPLHRLVGSDGIGRMDFHLEDPEKSHGLTARAKRECNLSRGNLIQPPLYCDTSPDD